MHQFLILPWVPHYKIVIYKVLKLKSDIDRINMKI